VLEERFENEDHIQLKFQLLNHKHIKLVTSIRDGIWRNSSNIPHDFAEACTEKKQEKRRLQMIKAVETIK